MVRNVLSFRLRDWGGIALCTFGIRVEHGILQNAIRFQSGVVDADLRVLLLRWIGESPCPFSCVFLLAFCFVFRYNKKDIV